MSAEEQQKFLSQIDQNKDSLIQRLATAVAIPSVSGDASYRPPGPRDGRLAAR